MPPFPLIMHSRCPIPGHAQRLRQIEIHYISTEPKGNLYGCLSLSSMNAFIQFCIGTSVGQREHAVRKVMRLHRSCSPTSGPELRPPLSTMDLPDHRHKEKSVENSRIRRMNG